MIPAGLPDAEVDVTVELARSLIALQHPDLADLPVVHLAHGWDNDLFRLGDHLTGRFPRREAAAALVEHEQQWVPRIAASLPLPVSAPVRVGRAALGYPYSWSIGPWFDGSAALMTPPEPSAAVDDLARFVLALHRPAPPDAPHNAVRGVPLIVRDAITHDRLGRLHDVVDVDALMSVWQDAGAAAVHHGPPMLLHGDLHPGNLIVRDGRIAAVIDFGDVCAGDPATDLGVAWMLFDEPWRTAFLGRLDADRDTRRRARGWALSIGAAIACAPGPMRELGITVLGRVLEPIS